MYSSNEGEVGGVSVKFCTGGSRLAIWDEREEQKDGAARRDS